MLPFLPDQHTSEVALYHQLIMIITLLMEQVVERRMRHPLNYVNIMDIMRSRRLKRHIMRLKILFTIMLLRQLQLEIYIQETTPIILLQLLQGKFIQNI